MKFIQKKSSLINQLIFFIMFRINLLIIFLGISTVFSYAQYGFDESYLYREQNTFDYLPIYSPQTGYIVDMVLIYHGGTARLPYTKEQIKPYVYRDNPDGGIDWLFDGFLFLEFRTYQGHAYIQEFFNREPNRARKREWQWLLDKNFELGKGISALNSVLDSLSNEGFTPQRKRKVVISLPEPMSGQKDWGELNGNLLDFSVDGDRLLALKWYIDETVKKFNSGGYNHLELAGFYWTKENDELTERLIQPVSDYLNNQNYILNWIPNWGPNRGKNWRNYNFNAAYIQPNTFFSSGSSSKLPIVCTYASLYKMGLEVEFDWDISKPAYVQKLHDYFDAFEKYKVLEKSAIAYYEGGRVFYTLSKDEGELQKAVFKRLCDIIAERQRRVDNIAE